MYSGGNTSLLLISGLSQNSVPRTKSGSVTAKNVWNSCILFTTELQFTMASLMLSFTGVLSLVGVLVCGEEVAWGVPGEQLPIGLLKTSDKLAEKEVGVDMLLMLRDFIESVSMVYLSSFESVIGVLNNTDEKFGASQVGHNHDDNLPYSYHHLFLHQERFLCIA